MIIDLGNIITDSFFGEVTLLFQEGKMVLIRKSETFKPEVIDNLKKSLDISAVVVIR